MPSSPTSGTEIVLDVLGGEVVHGRGGDDAVQQNRHQYHEGEDRPQLVGGHADAGTGQRVREDTVWAGPNTHSVPIVLNGRSVTVPVTASSSRLCILCCPTAVWSA